MHMIKPISFLLALFVACFPVHASSVSHARAAFFKIEAERKLSPMQPIYADGAEKIIELILETVGLEASFEVRRANVPNAAAVVYKGKRYILYNPSFIGAMNKAAKTPWASVAVLAHEVGHHLSGHTLDGKGSLPAIELEADEFSGYVLRKMGASLSEAQLAMKIIANAKATQTHPGRNDRLLAIASGWNHADDQLAGRDVSGKKNPPTTPEPEEQPVLAAKDIAFDVHFSFDPDTKYHVTVGNNLVKLFNNHLQVLGKLLATGKESFPLAFQTGSEDFLLVSDKGKIINRQGETLGYMTPRK